MIPCYKSTKLVLDKLLVIGLLIVLSPLFILLILVVYFDQGNVFYIQQRPGLLGQPFDLVKFQTMKNGEHISPTGKLLRKFSLDELPQLWNVLKGEMSLIGPRPYLMEYLELYSEKHNKRHWVLPGMTGWSQVNGGNYLSWQEKLDLDVYYVEKMSFLLDLTIFIKTLQLLLIGKKTAMPGHRFTGYQKEIN